MSVQNTQNGSKVDQSGSVKRGRVGKSHQDYWAPRLVKRTYTTREGEAAASADWSCRIAHLGRREFFNLGTANRAAAAGRARDIYLSLISAGWEATLQKFKPDMVVTKDGCTVGEYLDRVKAVSGLKPVTFEIYARKFRTLVAGVFKIDGGKAKFDYVNGGHQEWLQRVRSVRLDELTPDKVNGWKVKTLEAAAGSPLRLKRAGITVNSILRGAKSLFTDEIRKHLSLRLESPLPFDGVTLPKVGQSRYKSEIEPALLLKAAASELAKSEPELFKIVLLALGAGLRRDEIDKLQWRQILWRKSIVRVETTDHASTKTNDSEGDVDVDPGLLEILRGYIPKPGKASAFVIESSVGPRPESVRTHHYRCGRMFKKLIAWLRSKGITARNPLHALRKEFGSQICAQAGIYAASRALRHGSIGVTAGHYLDKTKPVVLEIRKLLFAEPTEVRAHAGANSADATGYETKAPSRESSAGSIDLGKATIVTLGLAPTR